MAFDIGIREAGDIRILAIRGRLTLGEASERFQQAMSALVEKGTRKIVVDLSDVPQIDSSGISVLVLYSAKLTRQGGSLRLVSPPGRVREALSVTRLTEAISTFDTQAAALAGF